MGKPIKYTDVIGSVMIGVNTRKESDVMKYASNIIEYESTLPVKTIEFDQCFGYYSKKERIHARFFLTPKKNSF